MGCVGKRIIRIKRPVTVIAAGSVVGHEEYKGPLGKCFDLHDPCDDRFGMDSWEKAEGEMQRMALSIALKKSALGEEKLDFLLAGDLQNQCAGAAYGLLSYRVPYLGLYGACSTAAEGLLLGALLLGGGAGERCAAVTSSHNCTAERQFRFPLEYGGQRTPTSQWTATAAGAVVLSGSEGDRPTFPGVNRVVVRDVLIGESIDSGLCDIANMGAAMAPAVADTLLRYFKESERTPASFDRIITGDLGIEGSKILLDLLSAHGIRMEKQHADCGNLLYDTVRQDKHAGGSGCGCSAAVMAGSVFGEMAEDAYREVLFVGSGALMNPMSLKQGLSIPGIGHLVHLSAVKREE